MSPRSAGPGLASKHPDLIEHTAIDAPQNSINEIERSLGYEVRAMNTVTVYVGREET